MNKSIFETLKVILEKEENLKKLQKIGAFIGGLSLVYFLGCKLFKRRTPFTHKSVVDVDDNKEIKVFQISISNDVLIDLKSRLERTRFPDEIENSEWKYGTNLEYMKTLVSFQNYPF